MSGNNIHINKARRRDNRRKRGRTNTKIVKSASTGSLAEHFHKQKQLAGPKDENAEDDQLTQVTDDSTFSSSSGAIGGSFSRSLYYAPTATTTTTTTTHIKRRSNLQRLNSSRSMKIDPSATAEEEKDNHTAMGDVSMSSAGGCDDDDDDDDDAVVDYEELEAIAIGKSSFDEEKEMAIAIEAAIAARRLIQQQQEEQNSFVQRRVGTFTRNVDEMLTTIQEEREAATAARGESSQQQDPSGVQGGGGQNAVTVPGRFETFSRNIETIASQGDQLLINMIQEEREASSSMGGFLQAKVGIFSRNLQAISSIVTGQQQEAS